MRNEAKFAILAVLLAAASCLTPACSSAGKHTSEIRRIYIYNVHYRRTPEKPASVDATPGDEDWKTKTPPGDVHDCEPLDHLFAGINLTSVRSCISQLNVPTKKIIETIYVLRREPEPFLEPDEPARTPECLQAALPKIPVPRELFFQARESGIVNCYSTRIDIGADEIYGRKLPGHYFKVRLTFPDEPTPTTDYETRIRLSQWALSSHVDPDSKTFLAKVVPDSFCRVCFGRQDLLEEHDPLPISWP